MGISIVVGLTLLLVLVVIFINALQQNKERLEAERRAELAKHKAVIDETDDVLSVAEHLPVSNRLRVILHNRIINALKISLELQASPDMRRRVSELEQTNKSINLDEPLTVDGFTLPEHEKQIIALIQGIKKLRMILRSELNKARIDSNLYSYEDGILTRFQLVVNIDTLIRRAKSALVAGMQGSARQYLEKGLAALNARKGQDPYVDTKKTEITKLLADMDEATRADRAEDLRRRIESEKNELDEIFAPKRKW